MSPVPALNRALTWTAAGLCAAAVLLVAWAWIDPLGPEWRMARALGCGAVSACVFRLREYVRRVPVPGRNGGLFTYEQSPLAYHLSFVVFMLIMGFVAWMWLR